MVTTTTFGPLLCNFDALLGAAEKTASGAEGVEGAELRREERSGQARTCRDRAKRRRRVSLRVPSSALGLRWSEQGGGVRVADPDGGGASVHVRATPQHEVLRAGLRGRTGGRRERAGLVLGPGLQGRGRDGAGTHEADREGGSEAGQAERAGHDLGGGRKGGGVHRKVPGRDETAEREVDRRLQGDARPWRRIAARPAVGYCVQLVINL